MRCPTVENRFESFGDQGWKRPVQPWSKINLPCRQWVSKLTTSFWRFLLLMVTPLWLDFERRWCKVPWTLCQDSESSSRHHCASLSPHLTQTLLIFALLRYAFRFQFISIISHKTQGLLKLIPCNSSQKQNWNFGLYFCNISKFVSVIHLIYIYHWVIRNLDQSLF